MTASSRTDSKKYHDSTAKIAGAIESAITSACSDLQLDDYESAECARAAVRKIRKNQIESESGRSSRTGGDSDAGSVASAESSSTWHSVQKPSRAGESIVPETKKQERITSSKPIRVYVDGCFDIMHSGHYNVLRQARQLGDILVAGVKGLPL